MKRFPIAIASATVAVVLLVPGCEDSNVPLSHPAQSKPDERLLGIWEQRNDDKGTSYFVVGRLGGNAPDAVMRMVTISQNAAGELQSPEQALMFPTTLGEKHYLNVAMMPQEKIDQVRKDGWKDDLLKSYLIVKYQVTDDTLLVWATTNDFKKEAVQSGTIRGEVTTTKGFTNYRFTDTMEKLAEFVTSSDEKLFSAEPLRFQRLK